MGVVAPGEKSVIHQEDFSSSFTVSNTSCQ